MLGYMILQVDHRLILMPSYVVWIKSRQEVAVFFHMFITYAQIL